MMATTMTPREAIEGLLKKQTPHKCVPAFRLISEEPDAAGRWHMRRPGDDRVGILQVDRWMHPQEIAKEHQLRERLIANSMLDPYNWGFFFRSWDDILWEIARLRVANPGVAITQLIAGANGAAKTHFVARLFTLAMEQVKAEWAEHQRLFFSFSVDDTQSATIIESAIHYWQPQDYKPDSGRLQTRGNQKLGYNPASGYTDEQFALRNGAKYQARTWAQDISKLEGTRPVTCWSDEAVPPAFLEAISSRLLTAAEETVGWCPRWERLLREKEKNPLMWFPRDDIGRLLVGVHLITYTFKDGYTDTVRWFMEKAKVVKQIEADKELLPRRDGEGNIIGGELLPCLVHCKDPTRRVIWIYAWQNPMGGNWTGMRREMIGKPRPHVLWRCYGVAEGNADTPFPNFNVQIHLRPCPLWLPRHGTWYNIFDPVASGGRCWFGIWAIVLDDQWRGMAPGDIFVAHEYPQTNDMVPGVGTGDKCVWALPGGENGKGIYGEAQKEWPVGYEFRANEIRRIEAKLAMWQGITKPRPNAENSALFIPPGNRLMDSRAGNTETENETAAETIIGYMEQQGLYFVPVGRDSGVAQGQTNVHPGEQTLNHYLFYDKSLAELDEKTGWLDIHPSKGRGPKLRIAEHCTNIVDALTNYKGIANGGAASRFKDPIDCLRYLVISNPIHIDYELFDETNDELSCIQ